MYAFLFIQLEIFILNPTQKLNKVQDQGFLPPLWMAMGLGWPCMTPGGGSWR